MNDRKQFRFPTPEEMSALNAAAHRNRARLMKLMLLKGARSLKRSLAHLAAASTPRRLSHA
jgi:hypothetical protein